MTTIFLTENLTGMLYLECLKNSVYPRNLEIETNLKKRFFSEKVNYGIRSVRNCLNKVYPYIPVDLVDAVH